MDMKSASQVSIYSDITKVMGWQYVKVIADYATIP